MYHLRREWHGQILQLLSEHISKSKEHNLLITNIKKEMFMLPVMFDTVMFEDKVEEFCLKIEKYKDLSNYFKSFHDNKIEWAACYNQDVSSYMINNHLESFHK